jgi:hypothetical protein
MGFMGENGFWNFGEKMEKNGENGGKWTVSGGSTAAW